METNVWLYAGFTAFVLGTLALDLGVFHRKAHVVQPKEAAIWIAVWMALALAFAAVLYHWRGPDQALLFLTGYLIEQSLSADNIFVIVMIFGYFSVPEKYQHRVLFWGILGALVMRGGFIGMGALLIQKLSWIIYVFGAFLIVTGIKMAIRQDEEFDAEQNIVMRTARRFLRVTGVYDGQNFSRRRTVFPWRPRCSLYCCWSNSQTWSLPSIPSLRSLQSRQIPFSSIPRTFLRYSDCARCTSCWQAWSTSSSI